MTDTVLDLINIRQPLRALMYEKLIWKHLLGIGVKSSFAGDAANIRAFSYHTSGNIQTILGVIGFLVIVEAQPRTSTVWKWTASTPWSKKPSHPHPYMSMGKSLEKENL